MKLVFPEFASDVTGSFLNFCYSSICIDSYPTFFFLKIFFFYSKTTTFWKKVCFFRVTHNVPWRM